MRDLRSYESFDIRLIANNVENEGVSYPADRELVAGLLRWLAEYRDRDKAMKPS